MWIPLLLAEVGITGTNWCEIKTAIIRKTLTMQSEHRRKKAYTQEKFTNILALEMRESTRLSPLQI
jgi:hypothetical protein